MVFCGGVKKRGNEKLEAVVDLELELVVYDSLVLTRLEQLCAGTSLA